MLPKGNTLPNRNYETKKILCPIGHSLKQCFTVRSVGNHSTKRNMVIVVVMLAQRVLQQRYCGIFQKFQGSRDCLLIQIMKRTLDGMQMRGNVMDNFDMRLI
ncbi:hypothetical protein CR513_06450, partial [Mucuna pruriens]